MTMLASKSARGFFHPVLHKDSMPEDAVEMPDEIYQQICAGQSSATPIDWSGDLPQLLSPADPA